MSRHLVCAVRDLAVDAFVGPLFLAHNKASAVRMFSDAVNDPSVQFSRHPDDFVLFHVAFWNDDNGLVESVEPLRVIGARECVVKSNGSG